MWDFDQFAERTALISDDGGSLTYGELKGETNRLAEAVGTRCLVFSLCTNTLGSVVGYTAFMNHGIVPVLLNAQMDQDMLRELAETYRPSYIWAPKVQEKEFPDAPAVYESHNYVLLRLNGSEHCSLHQDLALLLTTSGSTGSPKLVRQSYENVLVNAQQIAEYLELDETERPVTTLPMNYTYGLSIINSHLLAGAAILLTESSIMTREFWRFMKEQKATSFGGVPYTYEMLDKLRFFRMELPDLRTMTQAGGKLTPELHKKFAEYALEQGKHFVVMYGQCEATARMGYLPYDKALEKYGSMGIAIPGGKLALIDAKGNEIAEPDVTGELVYYGKNVTMGYAECGEDLKLGDLRHGRLETGDMAKRDADGYYFIVGRKKRFLKIYGNRVNLDEIDRLIKARFDSLDCASAGVDDHMYIFVTDESVIEDVRSFIIEKTKLNHAAFHVIKIDKIPKNDAGKTLYKELVPYYQ